jgi:hypothetical protein
VWDIHNDYLRILVSILFGWSEICSIWCSIYYGVAYTKFYSYSLFLVFCNSIPTCIVSAMFLLFIMSIVILMVRFRDIMNSNSINNSRHHGWLLLIYSTGVSPLISNSLSTLSTIKWRRLLCTTHACHYIFCYCIYASHAMWYIIFSAIDTLWKSSCMLSSYFSSQQKCPNFLFLHPFKLFLPWIFSD